MEITRIIDFDSAHRILEHESKCKYLHGHRYSAHITIRGAKLDKLGRVIDFGAIKDICKTWIDNRLDHNVILNSRDPLLSLYENWSDREREQYFGDKAPFVVVDKNPTVEVIAEVILFPTLRRLIQAHDQKLELSEITLYETPNCYTTFRNPYL